MSHKRLRLISSLINKNERVLDVGTDHAFVPIFLLEDNITNNIDATDISKKPLGFAQKNLKDKGYLNDVNLILSDGFEKIDVNNYDVIIIAGMGGNTISKIISSKTFKGRYIIHATTSLGTIRKTIEKIGISIFNEIIIKEGKIFNIIIETKIGKNKLSKEELYMGPSLLNKDIDYTRDYYSYLLSKILKNGKLSGDKEFKSEERKWLEKALWKKVN